MKLVTAVIKPHKWEDVRAALETVGVTGMTTVEPTTTELAQKVRASSSSSHRGSGTSDSITVRA